MESVFLNPEELKEMTGRMQYRAQIRVLRALGIEHKVRPDGSPLVLRAHVETQLGGALPSAKMKSAQPNWGAM